MDKILNFRTEKRRMDYYNAYSKTLQLWDAAYKETEIDTSFGKSHCLICGDQNNKPLILLHAACCGSTIWYPNIKELSRKYLVHAIDLITEPSRSVLLTKVKTPGQDALWLNETLNALKLDKVFLCGLSIGSWTAANYAAAYPNRVDKLVLLSPIQTFTKIYYSFFIKLMKMGFKPSRESVEDYLGWGIKKEKPLPESVIEQFTAAVLNMNSNCLFPKKLKKEKLHQLTMPVMVLFGEKEYAFNVSKAIAIGEKYINLIETGVIKDASHLISTSQPEEVNHRIINFLRY